MLKHLQVATLCYIPKANLFLGHPVLCIWTRQELETILGLGSSKSYSEADDGRPVDGCLHDPQGQDDGQHAQDE